MHKWVKNDPVRLFSCNIFVTKSCYHFIFQLFLKKHVIDSMPFKILIYLTYILQNSNFCITTPSFNKWVKNDPYSFPMEFQWNIWFWSTVTDSNIYFMDHTDYITSVTSKDYCTQQHLIHEECETRTGKYPSVNCLEVLYIIPCIRQLWLLAERTKLKSSYTTRRPKDV